MIKFFASVALALSLILAPAAAFAQDKGAKEANPDSTRFKSEEVAAAPVVGLPMVDFDLTHDLDNILYLDLSNGQRVAIRLDPQWARETFTGIKTLAQQWKLPLIATNGIRYAQPTQRELMDVLTCVRYKTNVFEAGRLLEHNAERHLKLPRKMNRLFADLPEAIAGSLELSDRLQFTLADLGYEFPRYPTPPGETMDSI